MSAVKDLSGTGTPTYNAGIINLTRSQILYPEKSLTHLNDCGQCVVIVL